MKLSSLTSGNLAVRKLVFAAYVAAVLGATLAPLSSDAYDVVSGLDKLVHVGLFGGVAVLLCWNLDSVSLQTARFVVLLTTAFAAVIELVQGRLWYRSGDYWDLLAGAVGAVLGICFAWVVVKIWTKSEAMPS
ncbi:VanZ family protein [Gemmatimonadota bacterium]